MVNNVLYFESITRELDALKGRVRNFIDDQHWQTDGEWKESVLRTILRRHLPKSIGVGKGFIITRERPSSQIDILIYDTSGPILYQDGELLFITPDNVLGIIEVKTGIRHSDLNEALRKLADNVELASQFGGLNRFFGLFSYESDVTDLNLPLKFLRDVTASSYDRIINCISLGDSYFVRYWEHDPLNSDEYVQRWHSYSLEHKAPAYFIYNVIEHLCPNSVLPYNSLWFPDEGKEPHKIGELSWR